MKLTTTQRDRAAGVLLGQACGDALGVPYEFGRPPMKHDPVMKGGGLGPYAPGEWSDDTQMAICIARVAATGADLTGEAALDEIAKEFVDWRRHGASDIGNQTAAVLGAGETEARNHARGSGRSGDERGYPWATFLLKAASDFTATHARAAGNGALMRNGIVGLTRLDDREATARAATAVASLTHADPLVADSCVLHAEAVRVAVIEGRLDLRAGLDLIPAQRRSQWMIWIDSAANADPASIGGNGSTFGALRAAWAAITSTDDRSSGHARRALIAAVRAGHDTDTVAAITGALVGARYGVSGLPTASRRRVHGWPGLRGRDLVELALRTVGECDDASWPARDHEKSWGGATEGPVPWSDRLTIGNQAALATTKATAVVSLSRIGRLEDRGTDKHVQAWLVDSDDSAAHNDLAYALGDAALAVQVLLDEGESVFLHCVHAHHRTPSVAVLHAMRFGGLERNDALNAVRTASGDNVFDGLLWQTALEEGESHEQ